ncbi:MAG: type II secretion system protein GspL [bacterium]
MSLLILQPQRLHAERLNYALLEKPTAKAQAVTAFTQGAWSEIKQQQRKRKVVLLLPSEDVTLLTVRIPSRNKKQLKQAIPYALEDQVADDIDTLSFAFTQPDAKTDQVFVAAIKQTTLQTWVNAVKTQGFTVHYVLPDVFALPYQEKSWSLYEQDNPQTSASTRLLIRTGLFSGWVCPMMLAPTLLAQTLRDTGGQDQPATPNHLWVDANDQFGQQLSQSLPDQLNEQITIEAKQHTFNVESLQNAFALNLLTGITQKSSHLPKVNWRRWRVALISSLLAMSAGSGLRYYENVQLEQQLNQVKQAITDAYRRAFPDDKRLVDPKVQMEQKLKVLQGSTQQPKSQSPLPLLSAVAPHLSTGLELRRIEFRQKSGLVLRLAAKSLDDLNRLEQRLKQVPNITTRLETSVSSGNAQGKLTVTTNQP